MVKAERNRWFARGASITGVLALFVSTFAASPATASPIAAFELPQTRAHAAPLKMAPSPSEFDPGFIISNENFYDRAAMTEAQIQAFLVSKGSVLATYRTTVSDRDPDSSWRTGNEICRAFTGGTNLLASTIIYRAQAACNISARVLLVTLQKEQSLITRSSASAGVFRKAMGYGCPDSDVCDSAYYGFGNQVYQAANQLHNYSVGAFARQPGVHTIQYHPEPSCGSSTFNIRNFATAALYNYTPYRPNAAALSNMPGMGNSCSSYGNRNFWYFFYSWFGNPVGIHPEGVEVARVGGDDRYEVGVNLSRANFEPGVPVVYLASGQVFSDALSSAPAAASQGGPVLLTRTDVLPPVVLEEIERLAPHRIVVVGGPSSVSEAVYQQLVHMTPEITRLSGADRYEVSLNVARYAFGESGAASAFLATGRVFSDALSASAAAGKIQGPVILVRGTTPSLDEETSAVLDHLQVERVYVAGGPPSVSAGIEEELRLRFGATSVTRYGGSDRYVVSSALNGDQFDNADTVYVASGQLFSDALSGAPIAGATSSPLYILRSGCMSREVASQIIELGAKRMIILGGPSSVGPDVADFRNC